jgi:exosortase
LAYPIYFKRFFPIAVAVISFLALYHHVIFELVQDWSSNDNYSHGFLVPLISGYLIWQNREKISLFEAKPSNIGLLFLLISLFFFIVAHIGAELFTMRFSMLLVLWSLALSFFGWHVAKIVSLPIAYLLFMVPIPAIIWNKIAFPLKLFATQMAVGLIKILNITVYSEGNIIFLSNTTLEVVDACSGLRSLTTLLALSAAFAIITDHTRLKKFILFLSAVPLAILLNIVRLSATAVLAKHFGPQVAQGFLHEVSGIVVFLLALILLFMFNKLLLRIPPRNPTS